VRTVELAPADPCRRGDVHGADHDLACAERLEQEAVRFGLEHELVVVEPSGDRAGDSSL
jgi:hypothetical protein